MFPASKYSKLTLANDNKKSGKSHHNIITPFQIMEDNIFDHRPHITSTKFGGVRVTKTKTIADAGKKLTIDDKEVMLKLIARIDALKKSKA